MDMNITTTRSLLTRLWTPDVDALQMAIGRLTSRRPSTGDCRVALFEVIGDNSLHVNVTHRHQTQAPRGWAGPGVLPQGFVHNRTFGDMPLNHIVRHIRKMVFSGQNLRNRDPRSRVTLSDQLQEAWLHQVQRSASSHSQSTGRC
jgi:hypothetical protein